MEDRKIQRHSYGKRVKVAEKKGTDDFTLG
jgi:hypothetical protein